MTKKTLICQILLGLAFLAAAIATYMANAVLRILESNPSMAFFTRQDPNEVKYVLYSSLGLMAVIVVASILLFLQKLKPAWITILVLPVVAVIGLFGGGTIPIFVCGLFGLIAAFMAKRMATERDMAAVLDEP